MGHGGANGPGAHRVDAHALAHHLLSQADGEAGHRTLGGRVVDGGARLADVRSPRGDVDDRAAGAAVRGRHAPQRLLRAVEDAHHVDLQQPLHIRGVQVGHPCARPQHGGVVDQGRERSELAVHGGEHLRHLIGPTDVGVDGDGASAVGLDLRAQLAGRLGLGAIIHAHAVAARAQQARGRGADPAASSGYDGDVSHAANLPPGGAPPSGPSIARAVGAVVFRAPLEGGGRQVKQMLAELVMQMLRLADRMLSLGDGRQLRARRTPLRRRSGSQARTATALRCRSTLLQRAVRSRSPSNDRSGKRDGGRYRFVTHRVARCLPNRDRTDRL